MAEQKKNELLKLVKIVFFFLASYVLIYFIGLATPLADFPFMQKNWLLQSDYMLILLPVAGFFFSYFAIEWANSGSFFEKKIGSSLFYPAALILTGIAAYYAAIWFFMENNRQLGGSGAFDFWKLLIESQYIYFVIAAVLAWVSARIMEKMPE